MVLSQIIPGMELILQSMGEELLEDSSVGVRVQLIRVKGTEQLPLKYESEGIKKIISILHLMIAAYNNPSITLAVDELDSGIYEYLLGELLRIMQNSGRGQLVFTSHNLYPLETLHTSSIVFTTTAPENRYTRLSYIKSSNNLRLRYLREIMLGSDGDAELYQETDNAEIAHAFRFQFTRPVRGATSTIIAKANGRNVSIPAPRMGERHTWTASFQFTRPLRGATIICAFYQRDLFQSTPPHVGSDGITTAF